MTREYTYDLYMWFTGIKYYKLAVEKDRDSILTTINDHKETKH